MKASTLLLKRDIQLIGICFTLQSSRYEAEGKLCIDGLKQVTTESVY